MAPEAVQPLRINKSSLSAASAKMANPAAARPLAEISPMGIRRNSPSFNQITKKLTFNRDSSPFDNTPGQSPLLFWKDREATSPHQFSSENTPLCDASPSPTRRNSLEKLKKASRVKNSNMFALEHHHDYDPDVSSIVERPLANGRPLSGQVNGGAWETAHPEGLPSGASQLRGHRRTESNANNQLTNTQQLVKSSNKGQFPPRSPQKSSLSWNSRYGGESSFSPEDDTWSDGEDSGRDTRATTPRASRQPKSVTFDAAPPQINEYEMITPDPSSVASGSREGSYDSEPFDMDDHFERGSPGDQDDSFDDSLVDSGKTPVVLPEEWRFMSPEVVSTDLARTFEDPFEVSGNDASPTSNPTSKQETSSLSRSASVNSDGSRRPLPPLPALQPGFLNQAQKDAKKLSDETTLPQRLLPSPPRPASVSKAEILSMRSPPMSLEDRLQLLAMQDQNRHNEQGVIATSCNAPVKASNPCDVHGEPSTTTGVVAEEPVECFAMSPQQEHESFSSSAAASNHDYANLDPDVPIPSREASSNYDGGDITVIIKREDDDERELHDLYALPESESMLEDSFSHLEEYNRDSSVVHHDIYQDEQSLLEETPSSKAGAAIKVQEIFQNLLTMGDDHITSNPTEVATPAPEVMIVPDESRLKIPQLTSSFSSEDFGLSLQSYMTPSPPAEPMHELEQPSRLDCSKSCSSRSPTPTQKLAPPQVFRKDSFQDDSDTAESVIRRSMESQSSVSDSSIVPEPIATVRASGGKLKTRPSATPTDIQAMAAARRHVSGEKPLESVLHRSRPSHRRGLSTQTSVARGDSLESYHTTEDSVTKPQHTGVNLDVALDEATEDAGFGLDAEFDRVIQAQKRGYLMRQHTKLVVANNRQFNDEKEDVDQPTTSGVQVNDVRAIRSAGNSPRKSSAQTWTTEPWNGRTRRQSTRKSQIVPEKRMSLGPVPPLPGRESNVLNSGEVATDEQFTIEDGQVDRERGRLFVKVVGIKDLNLPLPKKDRCSFQLTLDNGMHCVTTAPMELSASAAIGQEFELVVFDDLEFQLTLSAKLERPKSQAGSLDSYASASQSTKFKGFKSSVLSRLLTSPKKRREQERQQQEQEARAEQLRTQEFEAKRSAYDPTAWDLQHELVGSDGSFGRAFVSLKDHEDRAFGRPYAVDEICWNEWAVADEAIASSTRSKLGGIKRRPPYQIAKLELQLLYIPKPRDAKDEDMPKSMSACVRQLKEAEAQVQVQFEGHLSQQGGDCPYWRRRFFKLNGAKLTAFHESTRQPRATINLAKASKLIDDRSSLTQTETSPVKGGRSRRKSAFAEDEEGYMFVEEGFRIRFANGEIIDFYADSGAQKLEWMKVLSEVVGKDLTAGKASWVEAVLAREKALAAGKAGPKAHAHPNPPKRLSSSRAPTSPSKPTASVNTSLLAEIRPPPIAKSPRHSMAVGSATKSPMKKSEIPVLTPMTRPQKPEGSGRRAMVRSMIF